MLKNYSSSKSLASIFADIQKTLVKHGARKIMFDYDDSGKATAITFVVKTAKGELPVVLPARIDKVAEVLLKQRAASLARGLRPHHRQEVLVQAERTGWRNILDWIDAQMALLETEMVEFEQIFLPYFVNREGKTVYQMFTEGRLQLGSGESE